jgi:hypothetical protein
MEKISPEDLKLIVSNLLDKEGSKKFENVVDIGTFLWKVVHKILETTKDASLKLQQKEDILVEISGTVINFLEEKGIITIELAEKGRNLLKTADVFLDVLIGMYSFVTVNEVVKNPSKENCIKSIFSILSCFSAKVDSQNAPKVSSDKEPKVQIIEEKNASGTGLIIDEIKFHENSIFKPKVEEASLKVEEPKVEEASLKVEEPKVEEASLKVEEASFKVEEASFKVEEPKVEEVLEQTPKIEEASLKVEEEIISENSSVVAIFGDIVDSKQENMESID